MKKGYLTVYLSLSLALIISFVLTLVEGARISTIRMEAECVADIGMNSVLAEFHREMLEQYDLLFVDMSYGTNNPRIENSAEHLRSYIQKNFTSQETVIFSPRDFLAMSVDRAVILEYSLASDDDGEVMRRQALDYMEGASVEGMMARILGQIGEMESLGLDTRDIAGERNNIQAQIDSIELPTHENEEGEEEEITLDNPADKVNASRNSLILSMVLGDTKGVSRAAVRTGELISHRTKRRGNGINPDYSKPERITDNLLFDCYLFDKCGWYGNELDKSLLKYQIEYIIAGEESDMDNLEKIVKRLLLWREVANVIYIFSDSAKCAEAEALALTLTAVLQVPALVQPVKYSILFAWAYIESLQDVKCLLQGGKVPLLKTSGDWKTSIENVIDFSGKVKGAETGGRGLSYQDYLRIMLYLQKKASKNMRTMDIMEMDIRKTPGNSHFCMDACFDSFLSEIAITSAFGYQCRIRKRYGYD